MKSFLIATVFLLITLNAFAHKGHQCIHDKISSSYEPVIQKLTENELRERKLETGTTRPLKIVIDDSNLNGGGISSDQKSYITGKLVPVATQFLSRRLQVNSKGIFKYPATMTKCYQTPIPAAHKANGVDADLIIYVTASNEPNQNFIAWATACYQDPVNGRPLAGQINYNLNYLKLSDDKFEEQVDTTLHEMTHVLAFSGQLYKFFRKSFDSNELQPEADIWETLTVGRGGKTRQIIKTKTVLATARKYFNCPSINGVEIENNGGSGSAGAHWERTILHNEEMTASSIPDASYSEFTLSILQDSGWYMVDFSRAEPMFFGKGAGCDFVNNACQMSTPIREWCSNGDTNVCTFNFKTKAHCNYETFSDNCAYAQGYSNGNCEDSSQTNGNSPILGETWGKGSRCVVGNTILSNYNPTSTQTLCYKYSCTSDGKIKFFPVGGSEIVCTRAGEIAKASGKFQGTIQCPDPKVYCQDFYLACPNYCSSKGYCVKGKCECRAGFGGEDCSQVDNGSGGSGPTPIPSDPCAKITCPTNSQCSNGNCNCYSGYEGPSCTPVNKCNGIDCGSYGTCSDGTCICNSGYTGSRCENSPVDPCSSINCGNNGYCNKGTCTCFKGFSGSRCQNTDSNPNPNPNPNPTPNSGTASNGCPNNCNGRGNCVAGTCSCLEGFSGNSCEVAQQGYIGSCPNLCNGYAQRGTCQQMTTQFSSGDQQVEYSCKCEDGWTGDDCFTLLDNFSNCPNNCGNSSQYGTCDSLTGKCKCTTWYVGADCSGPLCPGNCNNKGTCSASIKTVNKVSTTTAQCKNCQSGSLPYCL